MGVSTYSETMKTVMVASEGAKRGAGRQATTRTTTTTTTESRQTQRIWCPQHAIEIRSGGRGVYRLARWKGNKTDGVGGAQILLIAPSCEAFAPQSISRGLQQAEQGVYPFTRSA